METMSLEQLKAAVYDRLALIEQCQKEIQLYNQEISKLAESKKQK